MGNIKEDEKSSDINHLNLMKQLNDLQKKSQDIRKQVESVRLERLSTHNLK